MPKAWVIMERMSEWEYNEEVGSYEVNTEEPVAVALRFEDTLEYRKPFDLADYVIVEVELL